MRSKHIFQYELSRQFPELQSLQSFRCRSIVLRSLQFSFVHTALITMEDNFGDVKPDLEGATVSSVAQTEEDEFQLQCRMYEEEYPAVRKAYSTSGR